MVLQLRGSNKEKNVVVSSTQDIHVSTAEQTYLLMNPPGSMFCDEKSFLEVIFFLLLQLFTNKPKPGVRKCQTCLYRWWGKLSKLYLLEINLLFQPLHPSTVANTPPLANSSLTWLLTPFTS